MASEAPTVQRVTSEAAGGQAKFGNDYRRPMPAPRRPQAAAEPRSAPPPTGAREPARYLHLKLLAPILVFEGALRRLPDHQGLILSLCSRPTTARRVTLGWPTSANCGTTRTSGRRSRTYLRVHAFDGGRLADARPGRGPDHELVLQGPHVGSGLLAIPWAVPDIPVVLTFSSCSTRTSASSTASRRRSSASTTTSSGSASQPRLHRHHG